MNVCTYGIDIFRGFSDRESATQIEFSTCTTDENIQIEIRCWRPMPKATVLASVHQPEPDTATGAIFEQGREVGLLAQQLFPGGVEVNGDGGLDDAMMMRYGANAQSVARCQGNSITLLTETPLDSPSSHRSTHSSAWGYARYQHCETIPNKF